MSKTFDNCKIPEVVHRSFSINLHSGNWKKCRKGDCMGNYSVLSNKNSGKFDFLSLLQSLLCA